jgi:hypothetical protein
MNKKLTLKKQDIRVLTHDETARIAGGLTFAGCCDATSGLRDPFSRGGTCCYLNSEILSPTR